VRPVYSTLLAVVQGLNEPREFSAPADATVVIRDVDVYWGGGLTADVSFRLMGSAGQTIWEVHVNADVPPYDSRCWQWRGRQVIPPGSTWAISGAGGNFDVAVSGYLLAMP
jgi:hypothetical protein